MKHWMDSRSYVSISFVSFIPSRCLFDCHNFCSILVSSHLCYVLCDFLLGCALNVGIVSLNLVAIKVMKMFHHIASVLSIYICFLSLVECAELSLPP